MGKNHSIIIVEEKKVAYVYGQSGMDMFEKRREARVKSKWKNRSPMRAFRCATEYVLLKKKIPNGSQN